MNFVSKSLLVLCVSCVSSVFADYSTSSTAPDAKKAAMAEWMKYATPGQQHKELQALKGNWKYTMKWWESAEAKPESSKGTNTNKMVMDGRFLQQETKGKAMGKTFTGMGLTGFDNVKQEFQTVWLDNMGTGMVLGTGTWDADAKAVNESGTFGCPMTGQKNRPYRSVTKIIDKNNYTYEMFQTDKDGKEYKTMEIVYKRS